MEQIKPTELRIGNYVKSDAYDFVKVCGTNLETEEILPEFELLGQGDWWGLDNFEPIPLTEEVLRAAGFEFKRGWKANGGEIDVDQYVLGQFDVAVASIGGIALTWRDRAINVQYLHQLQNLYFALTGSELEVSLPLIGNSPIRE